MWKYAVGSLLQFPTILNITFPQNNCQQKKNKNKKTDFHVSRMKMFVMLMKLSFFTLEDASSSRLCFFFSPAIIFPFNHQNDLLAFFLFFVDIRWFCFRNAPRPPSKRATNCGENMWVRKWFMIYIKFELSSLFSMESLRLFKFFHALNTK